MTERPQSGGTRRRPGLAASLALIISIAVLPLGMISIFQTSRVLEEQRAVSDAVLLSRTQKAASGARELIRTTVGTAEALAASTFVLYTEDDACNAVFASLARSKPEIAFAGFVDNDLMLTCASDPTLGDISLPDDFADRIEAEGTHIEVAPEALFNGRYMLSVSAPSYSGDDIVGTIWVVVPMQFASETLSESDEAVELALFNSDGEVLLTEGFSDDRRRMLPQDRALSELSSNGRMVFRDENRTGEERDFAVAPILEDRIFVLGSWLPETTDAALSRRAEVMTMVFPLLMWLAALFVAYIGVHRLVIRHVADLRRWMLSYSKGNREFAHAELKDAPQELETVASAFRTMASRLSQHEKRREEDLEEISTLFREVHHRVKNNLQLITSMMNMQIRATSSPEAKSLLRRVQDRVMALSAIHRYLYLARKLSLVQADELLEEIIRQLIVVGQIDGQGRRINVTTAFDPVQVIPDQSVPLSLLATEAATNAVKYCGSSGGEPPWINLAMKTEENGDVHFSVVNSRGDDSLAEPKDDGTAHFDNRGLGSKLIESFVSQLGGTLETLSLPDRFELHASFTPLSNDGPDSPKY